VWISGEPATAPTCDRASSALPIAGLFCCKNYPQPVVNFGRKKATFRRPGGAFFVDFCLLHILEGMKNLSHIWGCQTEQLSDFSTVRAVYPQFSGSYPQFDTWQSKQQHHMWLVTNPGWRSVFPALPRYHPENDPVLPAAG
jgi:hypothetical protein